MKSADQVRAQLALVERKVVNLPVGSDHQKALWLLSRTLKWVLGDGGVPPGKVIACMRAHVPDATSYGNVRAFKRGR